AGAPAAGWRDRIFRGARRDGPDRQRCRRAAADIEWRRSETAGPFRTGSHHPRERVKLQGAFGGSVTGPTPLLDFFKRGEVPRDVRLLAAQGALAPRALEQLSILVLLLEDADEEV